MTHTITIAGLGNYGLDELPLGVYRYLINTAKIYARTLDHPVIQELRDAEKAEIEWISFDDVYESHDEFAEVYENIVTQLVEAAQSEDIVYAVPGHPRVAETTTALLTAYAGSHDDIELQVLGGKSFIDDVFEAVQVDPNDGFTLLDGTALEAAQLNIRTHTLITQVYSAMTAGDLKLTLMERYPDDYTVQIVDGARSTGAALIETPLFELDHHDIFSNLTSVFVPRIEDADLMHRDFDFAETVIDTLVDDEKGCSWDKKQTHDSLNRYLLEETFELFEAIDNEDDWHMIEELGDILLQVMLHTSIGKKEGYMDVHEVIESMNDKMIRRHPHVFGEAHAENVEDLKAIWSDAKSKEGKQERVKFEKVFADHFMALYDDIKNKDYNEAELKAFLEKKEGK
ncbi:nucleotide pyrophosphohydrolase [Staphylococcus condimenti]|uniref:Nucleotide pyrophosphohydrolase n=1 Tax=Staphylococcus condimenti TaxID=70255 RepID=A0A4Q7CPA9_9STAP|nr:MazG nucleotide pyrophosphohydrolase domain-containing protein [Staphylococcus condimenti]RZI03807.1 nucleotide pyrophosphohydrolase [Staphylococcus condimenti]RZI05760.1 nucleotide pyrophosphohydrolase [Staphylococcus condimenti]